MNECNGCLMTGRGHMVFPCLLRDPFSFLCTARHSPSTMWRQNAATGASLRPSRSVAWCATHLHTFCCPAVVSRKRGIQRKRKPQGRDGALRGAHTTPRAVRVPGAISAVIRPIGYRRLLQGGAAIDTPPDTISTAFDPPGLCMRCSLATGCLCCRRYRYVPRGSQPISNRSVH